MRKPHYKSVAQQWFLNVFAVVAGAALLLAVVFSAVYSGNYYDRLARLGDVYAEPFSALSACNGNTLCDRAISLAEEYAYRDRLEVQVYDGTDRLVVSTTGFETRDAVGPDYAAAKTAGNHKAVARSTQSGGERVLACTVALYTEDGSYLGAYRWISSMTAADRHMTTVVLLVVGVFFFVLAVLSISGLYFIKSIISPIREVGLVARRIAAGDFEARIENNKNDEIGELCDSVNFMATELSAADKMKNDFISSVSHELRTPLTAIRGWGETAKMSLGEDDALVERGLEVVLGEADRLSGLVEDLLSFSRMQNGKLTVNTRPIDLSELLTGAVNMYVELARQQGIEVSYTPPAAPSVVMGDRDRLKQVFINVIDNAVKYTEKGGLVLVVQTKEEACVRIIVKDTGVGIPAQDLDRVKEKFFKSNKTVRGSGIGLAVADEILKQHDGLLFIESTEGVGTTVTMVLPLYEPPEDSGEQPQPMMAGQLPEAPNMENLPDLLPAETEILKKEHDENG